MKASSSLCPPQVARNLPTHTRTNNSGLIQINGENYTFIETVSDGDCGVDACRRILAQAKITLTDPLSEIRRKIAKIVAVSIEFHLNYSNSRQIPYLILQQYLQKAFNSLADIASLAIKMLKEIISDQQASLKDYPADRKTEILQDIQTNQKFINKLNSLHRWGDLNELFNLDSQRFITLIKRLLHVDITHISTSHKININDKAIPFSIKNYFARVSESKIWFTNTELKCFLRYYGLDFVKYRLDLASQVDGIILEFTNHGSERFYLHSNAIMDEQGFQEAHGGGTHWRLLSKVDSANSLSRLQLPTPQANPINFFAQDKSRKLEPTLLPRAGVKPEDNLMAKLEPSLEKLKVSYPVIPVSELIAKIEVLNESSKAADLNSESFLALRHQLNEIRYYFSTPNHVTGAAYQGGLAQLEDQYGASLFRVALMINSQTTKKRKLSETEFDTAHKGFTNLVKAYKVKRAYTDIHKGKKFVKAGLPKFARENPLFHNNPIRDLSKQNITLLIKELKQTGTNTKFGIRPEEEALFAILLKLPYKLQHATNAYYPMLNSGKFNSYKEIKRRNPYYESSYSTKGNVEKLGNDGFVFFRLYVDPINNSQTRYGDSSLIFDLNLLLQDGWVSLHDQLVPFSTPGATRFYQGKRLIRTAAVIAIKNNTQEKTLHDGLLYKYRISSIQSYNGKEDTQKSFGESIQVLEIKRSFLEEIFYGRDILLGIALSVIRELRYLEASGFRQHFLNRFAKADEAEKNQLLGKLIKDFFRIEGKYPVGLRLKADFDEGTQSFTPMAKLDRFSPSKQQFQVINPDGDGRYNLDMSCNSEDMKLAQLRAERKILEEKISNTRRQAGKIKGNKVNNEEKITNYSNYLEKMQIRLSEIKTIIDENESHRSRIINYFCDAFECEEEVFAKVSTSKLELINDYFSDWLEEGSVELTKLLRLSSQKLRLLLEQPFSDFFEDEPAILDDLVKVSVKDLINMSEYDLWFAAEEHKLTLDELIDLYRTDFTAFECVTCKDLAAKMLEIAPEVDETILHYALERGVEMDEIMETFNNEHEQEYFYLSLLNAGYNYDEYYSDRIEIQRLMNPEAFGKDYTPHTNVWSYLYPETTNDEADLTVLGGSEESSSDYSEADEGVGLTDLETTFLAMMGDESLNNIKTNDPKKIEEIINTLMWLRFEYEFPADFHNPRYQLEKLYQSYCRGILRDPGDVSGSDGASDSDEISEESEEE
jgi:hypothetical protein